MHYLITGHTGFKGAWLTLLLKSRGHTVSGIALEPVKGGLFLEASVENDLEQHLILDIRDRSALKEAIDEISPDVVIHMAAQPLVLESYDRPVETFDTNVTGTLNVLHGCSQASSIRAAIVVTTDKVYRDDGTGGYLESSPLGGHDPYSASKSMADLLTQSWMNLYPNFPIGIARAGNVIGYGDVSENRLIPDINRGLSTGSDVIVRNPQSVRPWQHVLDCLNGYLLFADSLIGTPTSSVPRILNFGPTPDSYRTVSELVSVVQGLAPGLKFEFSSFTRHLNHKETSFLTLDSDAARKVLGWKDRVLFESAVAWSIDFGDASPREKAIVQIQNFESMN